jgi:hypothetical protein
MQKKALYLQLVNIKESLKDQCFWMKNGRGERWQQQGALHVGKGAPLFSIGVV